LTTACMGGFCAVRENCRHYVADGVARLRPVERLCEPKTHTAFSPVPHDAFERSIVHLIDARQPTASGAAC
jgi:hypothetical protein